MQIMSEISGLRAALTEVRRGGKSIGVVPTMGAFHAGHLALMQRARSENDVVVVTLFVNPTQFNDADDFDKYPRDLDRDAVLAAENGVDYLFTPTPDAMYAHDFDTVVVVRALSDRLEGKSRPGHFAGVSTVVTKLLNIVQADRAYFGEKDWQQLQIIKRLVTDLDIPTEIVSMPTVREPDGLAMSSRNVRLSAAERKAAAVLSSALGDTVLIAGTGVHDAYQLAAWLHQTIAVEPLAKIDYAVVVDAGTMQEIDTIDRGAIAAVAVHFGKVRLIDNIFIPPPVTGAVRR